LKYVWAADQRDRKWRSGDDDDDLINSNGNWQQISEDAVDKADAVMMGSIRN